MTQPTTNIEELREELLQLKKDIALMRMEAIILKELLLRELQLKNTSEKSKKND